MYTEKEAKKYRCPNVTENCVGSKCMAWEWVSKFDDIIYENALTLKDGDKEKLLEKGYVELPAHGLALDLKAFFPITDDEKVKMKELTFGTQLLFGKETSDQTKWIGKCCSCNKG